MIVQWSTWKNAKTPNSFYDNEQVLFVNAVIKALEYTLNLRAEHYTPYLLVLREGKAS